MDYLWPHSGFRTYVVAIAAADLHERLQKHTPLNIATVAVGDSDVDCYYRAEWPILVQYSQNSERYSCHRPELVLGGNQKVALCPSIVYCFAF